MRYVHGLAFVALALVACLGDDRHGPGQVSDGSDGSGSNGSDGSDGSGSGSASAELGVTDGSGQAITELGVADDGPAMMKIANRGTVSSQPLVLTVTGDGSDDFVIDAASTCADQVLAPADTCTIAVRYQPRTDAPRLATLTVADSAGDSAQVGCGRRGRAW